MNAGAMSFKARLRNAAARIGVPAQLLLQDFFLERFLDRLCDLPARLEELSRSPALLDEWTRYRRRYPYAADIPFDRPIAAIRTLLSALR